MRRMLGARGRKEKKSQMQKEALLGAVVEQSAAGAQQGSHLSLHRAKQVRSEGEQVLPRLQPLQGCYIFNQSTPKARLLPSRCHPPRLCSRRLPAGQGPAQVTARGRPRPGQAAQGRCVVKAAGTPGRDRHHTGKVVLSEPFSSRCPFAPCLMARVRRGAGRARPSAPARASDAEFPAAKGLLPSAPLGSFSAPAIIFYLTLQLY